MSRARVPGGRWWLWAAGLAALAVSAADAGLLQLRRGYFTGGFLIEDAATSTANRAAFVGASLLLDLALTTPLALVIAWLGRGVVLAGRGGILITAALVCLPFAVADFISYEIARFLGDAFDLSLMFDLAGRRLGEVVAVSSGQAARAGAILVGLLAMAGLLTWWARRASRPAGGPRGQTPVARDVALAVTLLMVGAAAGTLGRASNAVLDNGLRRKPSGRVLAGATAILTDVDGDGFGWGNALADPDPFDASRHPYAVDVPGNGIDENGLAGDLADGAAYRERMEAVPRFVRTPPVLLVILESVRADALGEVVHGQAVTPVLDALARDGVSHPRAYSHNGYTVQSRYHLMSGSLSEQRSGTLIDDFQANGYETAYFSGQDESFGIEGGRFDSGFSRASARYDARQDVARRVSAFSTPGSLLVSSRVVLDRVRAFLATRDASRPLLLVLGIGDTHFPYAHEGLEPLLGVSPIPREGIVPAQATALRETYLQAVANVDKAIGAALTALGSHVGQRPVIVVVSDHGESLFDEGFLGHGYALNDAQTRVPLVVNGLDLQLPDPFGQVDLRDAIRDALARPVTGDRARLVPRGDAGVFQYLGVVNRPRAVAMRSTHGRIAYDLRANTLQVANGPPIPLAAANEEQLDAWRQVVHSWERIRLAQAASAALESR